LPVLKDGRLVGIISRRDVLRALVETPETACPA
jgi:CBS domain-containing protein